MMVNDGEVNALETLLMLSPCEPLPKEVTSF